MRIIHFIANTLRNYVRDGVAKVRLLAQLAALGYEYKVKV